MREDANGGETQGAVERFGYEAEGSERLARGSVAVAPGTWWSAELSVPEYDDLALFLRLRRHGPALAGYTGDIEADLQLPTGEIGAIVTLVSGVVAHARDHRVLPATRAS